MGWYLKLQQIAVNNNFKNGLIKYTVKIENKIRGDT